MPLVKINIKKGRSPGEKKQLLDIVHSSLVDAFKIPQNDRIQRICEFDDEAFEIPADRTDKFTIIEITILPGRSFEAKKNLYQLIFGKLKAIGYQDNDAAIVLTEPELNNWGVRGGYPASEINIGFNLNV
ncbi:MAG: tautomerase family protein [Desulfobacteraceae bacterium]|jgi:phenylpyruvate tautomerase PptA (4-oxalocrotonate tautomerase family)